MPRQPPKRVGMAAIRHVFKIKRTHFSGSLSVHDKIKTSSFPRRRESKLKQHKCLFKISFLNFKMDSRLRGNDGIVAFQAALKFFVVY